MGFVFDMSKNNLSRVTNISQNCWIMQNATTLRQERISSKVRLQHSVHLYRVRTIEAIQLVRFTFHFMINICKLRRTLIVTTP